MDARSVWCRVSSARRPAVRIRRASVKADAICAGLSVATRAAANSIANAMPSTWRQMSATASTFVVSSRNPGRTMVARSTNSRTASTRPTTSGTGAVVASGTGSEGTGYTSSPASANGSRLVASSRIAGQADSSRSARSAHSPRTCSQLSSTIKVDAPLRRRMSPAAGSESERSGTPTTVDTGRR